MKILLSLHQQYSPRLIRTTHYVESFIVVSSLPKIIHSSGLSAMHTWGVFLIFKGDE